MPQPKKVTSDGKNWTFTPGKNGSLIAPAQPSPDAFTMPDPQQTAKSISADQTKKNRMNLIRAIVASTRG